MKLFVIGTPYLTDEEWFRQHFEERLRYAHLEKNLIFLSSHAPGTERLVEKWATEHGFPMEIHPTQWITADQNGKKDLLPFLFSLVDNSDIVIAFWTERDKQISAVIDYAIRQGKLISLERYRPT